MILYGSIVRWRVRRALAGLLSITLAAACAGNPGVGALGEGGVAEPRITAIDTSVPPRHADVQLAQPAYAALVLVAPGHSATLLYPADTVTNNQLGAGAHRLRFEIPPLLVETDSQRLARIREAQRAAPRRRVPPATGSTSLGPIPPSIVPYLLLLTSPQELDYARMLERTAGVSIPTLDLEALNAVAKAIKGTLPSEPRNWAGYYTLVDLRRSR